MLFWPNKQGQGYGLKKKQKLETYLINEYEYYVLVC